ncbi:hypothetical protein K493DRAFT_376874 [Basidiobolus meristosporus CBS 931.73]|uniref:PiggyBac transposable element-derived protein domain-containing protein n=1 Tax=Basidiobolus meristosporus CBS 931.73 TaxID=1314790 RepID=A0A1Y1Y369_9FUNG|nr:hypothetical protein K493DRAFT_376874 [Basidiobolus meristosporus CBS 931.73]|eukprot:ORX92457.1 hypothetical protein K493DRAFT_376874 [Basidiobolus meristosporus CBS 931.73]
MPPASKHLDVNVRVSVFKRFIKHKEVKRLLSLRFDWNTPGLSFKGVTTARSTVNGNVKYDVILDLTTRSGRIFVCAYRDYKIKAFISSCSTTRLTGQRTFVGDNGEVITIQRPEVVEEYETHKKRWEMRFYGFILGICKANAYSSYRTFSYQKRGVSHFSFKDILAYNFLQYCKNLAGSDIKGPLGSQRQLRSDENHTYLSALRLSFHAVATLATQCVKTAIPGT